MSLEFQIVYPAFNESKNLPVLLRKAIAAAQQIGFSANDIQFLFVDNGSTDETPQVLSELKKGKDSEWFSSIRVSKNQGYGHGIFEGLKATTAPYIGWSHADLQCDPRDIFTAFHLAKSLGNTRFLIKGRRIKRKLSDHLFSKVFEFLAQIILWVRLSEVNAQPKVFHRDLLKQLNSPPKDFAFDLYVLYQFKKDKIRFYEIPVLFEERMSGESNWSKNFKLKYATILKMIRYLFRLKFAEKLG